MKLVTCSDDGSIKIYDGVSGQCVNTIEQGKKEKKNKIKK